MSQTSARKVNKSESPKDIVGAISHIKKNLFTSVFLKIFLNPSFATPMPRIAATFNCTSEVGMPLTRDAVKRREAEIKAITTASILPNRKISLPVFFTILCPNNELPIAKHGDTMRVANIRIWT